VIGRRAGGCPTPAGQTAPSTKATPAPSANAAVAATRKASWIATTAGSRSAGICGTATGLVGAYTWNADVPVIGSSVLDGTDHATEYVPA
jgi:hypothetical protein